MTPARYAIYFVPAADTALYRFGSAAIGYDCLSGRDVPLAAELQDHAADWRDLTEAPRAYGFHATLKAPFRLRDGASESALAEAFARFAASRATAPVFAPQVRILDRFAAVVPRRVPPALVELAGACVTTFEPWRAPISTQERERRIVARLDSRQIAYLDRWGYPYVFDEFRFHMTLTGPLPVERSHDIVARLTSMFARAHGKGEIAVDRLALLRQRGASGRFEVLCHEPIGSVRAA